MCFRPTGWDEHACRLVLQILNSLTNQIVNLFRKIVTCIKHVNQYAFCLLMFTTGGIPAPDYLHFL